MCLFTATLATCLSREFLCKSGLSSHFDVNGRHLCTKRPGGDDDARSRHAKHHDAADVATELTAWHAGAMDAWTAANDAAAAAIINAATGRCCQPCGCRYGVPLASLLVENLAILDFGSHVPTFADAPTAEASPANQGLVIIH